MRLAFLPLCVVCLIVGLSCGKTDDQPSGIQTAGDGAAAVASGSNDHDPTAGTGTPGSGSGAGASGDHGATTGAAGSRTSSGGSSAAAGGGAGRGSGSTSGRGGGRAGGSAAAGSGTAAGSGGSVAGSGGAASNRPACGTRGGVQCGTDQFCDTEPDADCGATDRGGVCETKSQVCADIYEPVCGCDDHTYSSDCNAHAAGVSVKSTGMCMTSAAGRTCGGIAALECDPGQFCNYETTAGGQGCDGKVADAGGKCEVIPASCAAENHPVCGCDHRTYASSCEAHAGAAAVLHDGGCTEKDCAAIGGRVAYGLGPAPMCNSGETEHGSVIGNDGSMPIEGAICCVP